MTMRWLFAVQSNILKNPQGIAQRTCHLLPCGLGDDVDVGAEYFRLYYPVVMSVRENYLRCLGVSHHNKVSRLVNKS